MSEPRRRVLVIGDVILDQTTKVRVRGVSPENAAVVVANETAVEFGPGGAANVALTALRLGAGVRLLGCNNDRRIDFLLSEAGVETTFYRPLTGSTPVKNRVVTTDGHYLLRLDQEQPGFGPTDDNWLRHDNPLTAVLDAELFSGAWGTPRPVVCLVNYDKGFFTHCVAKSVMWHLNQVTEHVSFPVLVDPGRTGDWGRFGSPRTVFRANLHQARQQAATVPLPAHRLEVFAADADPAEKWDEGAYRAAAFRVCQNLRATRTPFAYLVLTLGPGGLVLANPDASKVRYVPAGPVAAVDPCGAGDAVTAALAACLAADEAPLGWDAMEAAVVAAEKAARVAVARRGVYPVTREDMGWFKQTSSGPAACRTG